MTPIAQRKCVPSGVAVPGRNTGFVSPSSSSRKHHCPRQQSRDARIKVTLAGLFADRPKTYDLRLATVLPGLASIKEGYSIMAGFVGMSDLLIGLGVDSVSSDLLPC
jgi:hypothetical protein